MPPHKAPADCILQLKIESPRPDDCYERRVRITSGESKIVITALTEAMRKIFRARKPNGAG